MLRFSFPKIAAGKPRAICRKMKTIIRVPATGTGYFLLLVVFIQTLARSLEQLVGVPVGVPPDYYRNWTAN